MKKISCFRSPESPLRITIYENNSNLYTIDIGHLEKTVLGMVCCNNTLRGYIQKEDLIKLLEETLAELKKELLEPQNT